MTHMAEQDCFEMSLPLLYEECRKMIATRAHMCFSCDQIYSSQMHSSQITDEILFGFLKKMFMWRDVDRSRAFDVCSFCQALMAQCQSLWADKGRVIAKLHSQSDIRWRAWARNENKKVEMDWAIFEVTNPELKQDVLLRPEASLFRTRNELRFLSEVNPGALLRSLGRTSGPQIGQISNTISAIFHSVYITHEWCVIKRPETPLEEWVEGGIGVEGDSGALIVDEQETAVYGMLWGRTGDGPATMTIFTPMYEIALDILERTEAKNVKFVSGQEMPRHDNAEVQEGSQAADIAPITISMDEKGKQPAIEEASHAVDSAPITISMDNKGKQPALEEVMSSVDSEQQSSADTRHPHSFERYRGRDGPNRSIPQSLAQGSGQEPVGNVENSPWPGGHTYLRYAVAPEQE